MARREENPVKTKTRQALPSTPEIQVALNTWFEQVVPAKQTEPGLHLGLALYLGDLTSESISNLDDQSLAAIQLVTDRLSAIEAEDRTWQSLKESLDDAPWLRLQHGLDSGHSSKVQGPRRFRPDPSNIANVQDWYSQLVDVDFRAMSIREEQTEKFLGRAHEVVKSLLKSDVLPFSRMQRLIDVTVLAFPTPKRRCFKLYNLEVDLWMVSSRVFSFGSVDCSFFGRYQQATFELNPPYFTAQVTGSKSTAGPHVHFAVKLVTEDDHVDADEVASS